jgi:Tol biopolymer transport system component
MNIDGSDQRQLTNSPGGAQGAQFSPDGRWLVYRTSLGKSTVWKIPADGSGDRVQLTDKTSQGATVSPDGKMVAYFYREEANTPIRIAVAAFEGEPQPPIKTFELPEIWSPPLRWTPDGRALAYIDRQGGLYNIVAQPLDGGKPVKLTDFKTDRLFGFDFSRDGKQIALSRGAINSDVVLIKDFR